MVMGEVTIVCRPALTINEADARKLGVGILEVANCDLKSGPLQPERVGQYLPTHCSATTIEGCGSNSTEPWLIVIVD